MGNALGGKKNAKVMKITGETMKLKTPVTAAEVVRDYPAGSVLLESEAVKHYGIRAKPLEPQQELRPKRLYFLVELPKFNEEKVARRVRSGINMSAKDRLENLMLARRSISDLGIMKTASSITAEENDGGGVRLTMKLPKAELERMVKESKNEAEAAEKIVQLYVARNATAGGGGGSSMANGVEGVASHHHQQQHQGRCLGGDGGVKKAVQVREKRVGFLPINGGEVHRLAVAS